MLDFKAKMHQIQFQLRLCPRPSWRSLQRFPRSPSWIKWGLLLREGEEWGEEEGGGGREGREREGREGIGPQSYC